MKLKKIIAPILIVLIVIALAVTFYFSYQDRQTQPISGLIGSEKQAFFDDMDVQSILKDRYQIQVNYEKVGSRRIAVDGGTKGTVDNYDFAFPAGVPAAEKIRRDFDVAASYRVFYTPMAIASWQPVVEVLEANGIVSKRQDYYGILDMNALLGLMQAEMRWEDVPNNQSFSVGRRVLIKSTDIRSSNSAAMYLSLASYLANNNNIVRNPTEGIQVTPVVAPLFVDQGFLAGSSATPFEDYLIKGMGNSPLVMVYESQFLSQATQNANSIRPEMVLLYPEPTIYTQHTLTAMSDAGKRLGEALTNDPDLQKLAIKYGFRSNDPALISSFADNIKQSNLKNVPSTLNEVIDPPSYEVLEAMIQRIEQQL